MCTQLKAPSVLKCVLITFQHLLSPQRAPERLLQLAQNNQDTLVIEIDELLNRVRIEKNITKQLRTCTVYN